MNDIKYDRVCDVYDSENVESVSFSVESNVMLVRFNNSTEYRYYGVSIEVWGKVIASPNVGKMLYSLVTSKPNVYSYKRIDI